MHWDHVLHSRADRRWRQMLPNSFAPALGASIFIVAHGMASSTVQ